MATEPSVADPSPPPAKPGLFTLASLRPKREATPSAEAEPAESKALMAAPEPEVASAPPSTEPGMVPPEPPPPSLDATPLLEPTPPPAEPIPPLVKPAEPSTVAATPSPSPIIGFGSAASSTPPILATDCPACGRPVFAADNFCANCGHRVGSQAVAAASIAARAVAAPAPAGAPVTMPFRPVATVIAAIGLLVFGVLFGATVLAPDRTPVRPTSVPVGAASPSAVEHQVSVNVSVDETGGTGVDPWPNVAIGEPCPPTDPTLGDIGEGTAVVVADQAGTVLGRASLPAGRKSGIGICTYRTKLTVPETPVYAITVADRPATVIAIADLSTAGWTTDLRYAVLP